MPPCRSRPGRAGSRPPQAITALSPTPQPPTPQQRLEEVRSAAIRRIRRTLTDRYPTL